MDELNAILYVPEDKMSEFQEIYGINMSNLKGGRRNGI